MKKLLLLALVFYVSLITLSILKKDYDEAIAWFFASYWLSLLILHNEPRENKINEPLTNKNTMIKITLGEVKTQEKKEYPKLMRSSSGTLVFFLSEEEGIEISDQEKCWYSTEWDMDFSPTTTNLSPFKTHNMLIKDLPTFLRLKRQVNTLKKMAGMSITRPRGAFIQNI